MTQPLSREKLLQYGQCCGYRCQNCPYRPKHKKGSREVERPCTKS